jgi:hypothetical protein
LAYKWGSKLFFQWDALGVSTDKSIDYRQAPKKKPIANITLDLTIEYDRVRVRSVARA